VVIRSTPVIALVGRPNVGKSTLFNRLTGTRDALVADVPGVTRDRIYGFARTGGRPCVVVDTGGLSGVEEGIDGMVARQALLAIEESDAVLLLVDGRAGLSAGDEHIGAQLRRLGKQVVVAVNKTEGLDADLAMAEFHALGLGEPMAISAAHGQGTKTLLAAALERLDGPAEEDSPAPLGGAEEETLRLAIVGRPNVGKSTFINRLLGEERVLASAMPGTTRDAVEVPFLRAGRRYLLVDTAGVRRRARVQETVERFSVVKTLRAVEAANVVVLMLDAQQGIAEQDASLLGYVAERGRGLVLVVNKWDGMGSAQRDRVRSELARKLKFLDYARLHYISALHGSGVMEVLDSVVEAYASARRDLPTPQLTRVLQDAVTEHQPPLSGGFRVKLRYAHQGGQNPPLIVIHGSRVGKVPAAYQRFLVNRFRQAFGLRGTPVRVEFRSGENPYAPPAKGRSHRPGVIRRRRSQPSG
jgi:GTP-binding protein